MSNFVVLKLKQAFLTIIGKHVIRNTFETKLNIVHLNVFMKLT